MTDTILFTYLFMAVLGLHCCAGFSLVVESRGYSIVAVCGLLSMDRGAWWATICGIAESDRTERLTHTHTHTCTHCGGVSCGGAGALGCSGFSSCNLRAQERRLNSCGRRAWLLHSMWDLPGPGTESTSPTSAGEFFTT